MLNLFDTTPDVQNGVGDLPYDVWLQHFEEHKKSDKFYSKMNRGLIDDNCQHVLRGCWVEGKLCGVIATKYHSKYANLKWIMTFPDARGKGVFRTLCEDSVSRAFKVGMKHYRVSINPPALSAYGKVGFKVWGIQQSDCLLSIGQLRGDSISKLTWELDEYVEREVTKKGRGGCVKDNWSTAV